MNTLKTRNLIAKNYSFFKQHSFILSILGIIVCMIFFEKSISLNYKLIIYTISYIAKEILMLLIPILILPVIIKTIIEISSKNGSVIVLIAVILFIFSSNFVSIIIAYIAGLNFIPYLGGIESIRTYDQEEIIYSLFSFQFPDIDIAKITLLGLLAGIVFSYNKNRFLLKALDSSYKLSIFLFNKIFIFLIPFYIVGTILKTVNESDFISLIFIFSKIIVLVFLIQLSYAFILFFIGAGFSLKKCISNIINVMPALITGFSTMSSLITLPITLKSVKKITEDCSISRISIISTVNCHDIGDCISLPLIALAILYYIDGYLPGTKDYLYFALLAALMQFSTVSVPGGSIVILLPVLVKYLGFTQEMEVLILALSICVESIGTAMNVAGNTAFSIIASKLFKRKSSEEISSQLQINSIEVREKI